MSKARFRTRFGARTSRKRPEFIPCCVRVAAASKTLDEPKKPARPDTSNMPTHRAVLTWFDYLLHWAVYMFDQSPIFKIGERLTKLSVFVAVVFFLIQMWQQAIEARKEAERRTREEIRRSYDILGSESQSHAPHTRMLALATLRDFMKQDDSAQAAEFRKTMNSLGYSGLDLSKMILRNEYDLAGKNLARADLSKADLKGADLSEANLEGAKLSEADLTRAILRDATLNDADLSGAILRDAELPNAIMQNAKFSSADLVGGVLTANLSAANLTGAKLAEADLRGADLSNADLSGADLSNAKLAGYRPSSVASIGPAKLDGTTLINTKLTGANLQGVDMSTTRGLTLEQWDSAITDEYTIPPKNLRKELSSRE